MPQALTACKHTVSGSVSLPVTGVLFTFPSRYLFTIGRVGVFSLGRWASQLPTGRLVPRGTWGHKSLRSEDCRYRTLTRSGAPFQVASRPLSAHAGNAYVAPLVPRNPRIPTDTPFPGSRFRLFPFRSPLLRESRLMSLPPGTEMVQFPGFALRFYSFQTAMCVHDDTRVAPFGYPRISACVRLPRAFRSSPRPSSPQRAKASTVCSSFP